MSAFDKRTGLAGQGPTDDGGTKSEVTAPGPLVLHIPHASTAVPEWVRPQFVIDDAALAAEQSKLVDHFTDELFALPGEVATTVRFPVSRFVVDPERYEDDDCESMSERGMGVVYAKTTAGALLRRPLDPGQRSSLLDAYYRPHHRRLTAAVSNALAAHGGCVIVDGHSFASAPLPCDRDQRPDRPDICIGTNPFHTPQWLLEAGASACREAGWSVDIDHPFAGTIVPLDYLGRDPRVWSLMIEVNKRLYLDEGTATRGPQFESCRSRLNAVLRRLGDAASAELERRARLAAAYRATTFAADVNGGTVELRIDQTSAPLDDLLADHGVEDCAFITAWNPRSEPLSRAENDRRHRELLNLLADRGITPPAIYPGRGEPRGGDWAPEESVLVLGLSADAAVDLGRHFGQYAVVVGRSGEPARLAWCG